MSELDTSNFICRHINKPNEPDGGKKRSGIGSEKPTDLDRNIWIPEDSGYAHLKGGTSEGTY